MSLQHPFSSLLDYLRHQSNALHKIVRLRWYVRDVRGRRRSRNWNSKKKCYPCKTKSLFTLGSLAIGLRGMTWGWWRQSTLTGSSKDAMPGRLWTNNFATTIRQPSVLLKSFRIVKVSKILISRYSTTHNPNLQYTSLTNIGNTNFATKNPLIWKTQKRSLGLIRAYSQLNEIWTRPKLGLSIN